jgi:hypothetical protein
MVVDTSGVLGEPVRRFLDHLEPFVHALSEGAEYERDARDLLQSAAGLVVVGVLAADFSFDPSLVSERASDRRASRVASGPRWGKGV